MLPLLVLLADVDALLARARTMTAPERRCTERNGTDITVCGRRAVDRYRVPFVGYDPGDPRGRTVAAERNALIATRNSCQEMRAIQVGCGFAGAHLSVGGGRTTLTGRTLAP